jgi:hypothetical protein
MANRPVPPADETVPVRVVDREQHDSFRSTVHVDGAIANGIYPPGVFGSPANTFLGRTDTDTDTEDQP